MRVLLLGATGLVGTHALQQLLQHPDVTQVVAPTRRPLPSHAGLLAPVVDFAALPTQAAWWAVDAVICSLGSTQAAAGSRAAFARIDHDYPLQIAGLAQAHGARAFALTSAAGASLHSPFFYSRVKGRLEQDLRALGFDSLTLVRPGLIGGQRAQPRLAEGIASTALQVLGPVLPRGWRISPAERIAVALVQAVTTPLPGVHVVTARSLAG